MKLLELAALVAAVLAIDWIWTNWAAIKFASQHTGQITAAGDFITGLQGLGVPL